MFWSKLKTTATILMAGALLSGTALLGHRAIGLPQAPAAAGKQQPRARVDPEGKPTAAAPTGFESPELEAIGKARIEVAAKLRDATQRLWQAGEINIVEYLTVVKRYDEIMADVMVKTDADRVRYLEHQIATLKQIEDGTRELFRRGQATQRDLLTAELARLDAEYSLAKAKARDTSK
jgi:outer membrane protein TolC